jgi:hypothetical protein
MFMNRKGNMFVKLIILMLMMGACSGTSEKSLIGKNPLNNFSQDIKILSPLQTLRVDEKITVNIDAKNTGDDAWPNKGNDEKGTNCVALGFYWLDSVGKKIEHGQGVSMLPYGIKSGASVSLKVTIQAPPQPGNYKLIFSMFQHNVTWFDDKGATPLVVNVKVER